MKAEEECSCSERMFRGWLGKPGQTWPLSLFFKIVSSCRVFQFALLILHSRFECLFFFLQICFCIFKEGNSPLVWNDASSYFLNAGGWNGSVLKGRVGTILLYLWFQPSAELMFFWHTTAVECYCPIASFIFPVPFHSPPRTNWTFWEDDVRSPSFSGSSWVSW